MSLYQRPFDVSPDGRFLVVEHAGVAWRPNVLFLVPDWFDKIAVAARAAR